MKMTFKIMLTKIAALSIFVAGLAFASACNGNTEISSDEAKTVALAVVPGTVESSLAALEDTLPVYEVKVRLASGSAIYVWVHRGDGALYGMADEIGPFEYELAAPQPGLLSYSAAKAKAFAVKQGTQVAWNLKDKGGAFRHEFYVRDTGGQLWEVKIKSTTGETLSVEAKDAVD